MTLLKKAEKHAFVSPHLRALTFNNLACYYKATNKHRVALKFLEEALTTEKTLESDRNISDILLNICAVLSKLGKHKDALDAVLNSVYLLQEEILAISMSNFFEESATSKIRQPSVSGLTNDTEIEYLTVYEKSIFTNLENVSFESKRKFLLERLSILVVAYHNMGVEFEHLKLPREALNVFEKGWDLACQYLDSQSDLSIQLARISFDLRVILKLPERSSKTCVIDKNLTLFGITSKLNNRIMDKSNSNSYSSNEKHSDKTTSVFFNSVLENASPENEIGNKLNQINESNQIPNKKSEKYRISKVTKSEFKSQINSNTQFEDSNATPTDNSNETPLVIIPIFKHSDRLKPQNLTLKIDNSNFAKKKSNTTDYFEGNNQNLPKITPNKKSNKDNKPKRHSENREANGPNGKRSLVQKSTDTNPLESFLFKKVDNSFDTQTPTKNLLQIYNNPQPVKRVSFNVNVPVRQNSEKSKESRLYSASKNMNSRSNESSYKTFEVESDLNKSVGTEQSVKSGWLVPENLKIQNPQIDLKASSFIQKSALLNNKSGNSSLKSSSLIDSINTFENSQKKNKSEAQDWQSDLSVNSHASKFN